MNFNKAIFRVIKCLKLIGNSFSERSANPNSVFSRENNGTLYSWCCPNNILHSFALRRSRVNLMTFHIIDLIHDTCQICTRFKVGGDRGVTTSCFPYPVLPPPVPFCSFVSRLPPFIVFFPSSCKL